MKEILDLMLTEKKDLCDINYKSEFHHNLLHGVTLEGASNQFFEYLFNKKADPNSFQSFGYSAFHMLCRKKDLSHSLFSIFIQNKADINQKSFNVVTTPFHFLCENQNVNRLMISECIDLIGDRMMKDIYGKTPLDYLLQNKNLKLEALEAFFKNDFRIENISQYLFKCGNNVDFLNLFTEKKADINFLDTSGTNILHSLLNHEQMNIECAKFIIEKKIDVNCLNHVKNSFLHIYAEKGDSFLEMTKLLIENKADLNIKNMNGETALFLVTRSKNPNFDTLNFLLLHKSDPNIVNNSKKKCLDYLQPKNKSIFKIIFHFLFYGLKIENFPKYKYSNNKSICNLVEEIKKKNYFWNKNMFHLYPSFYKEIVKNFLLVLNYCYKNDVFPKIPKPVVSLFFELSSYNFNNF